MDLTSPPSGLSPCLLSPGQLSLSVSGSVQHIQGEEAGQNPLISCNTSSGNVSSGNASSGDENPAQRGFSCQYKYKPDYSRGLSFVPLCSGIFSLTACWHLQEGLSGFLNIAAGLSQAKHILSILRLRAPFNELSYCLFVLVNALEVTSLMCLNEIFQC